MGIKGLLQAVKPLLKASNVSHLRGKRVAIDGYCWLHKGVYGCCVELCNGGKSQTWINYCLSFIDLLLRNGILVTMVFDGANLPMKNLTENDREKSRQASLQKARELMHNGDKEAARNFFARAVDITPAMAAELIQIIKQSRPGVECIVAPYEADAQLAFLSANNLVDCVVTEDSDTIPYGCKDIIFKLERDGSCQRLQLNELYSEAIDKFDLRGFSEEMMLTMCILSGCDYLDSVKGMGLKTSYKHIIKHRTASNVLKALRLGGHLPIVQAATRSENNFNSSNSLSQLLQYELDFYQAILTFNHQVVYDPISKKTVHRTPLNRNAFPSQLLEIWWPNAHEPPELPFLGSLLSDDVSQGIANGFIDPVSKNPFPSQNQFPSNSVSSSNRTNNAVHTPAIPRPISSQNAFQTQQSKRESQSKQHGSIHVLQPIGNYKQAQGQAPNVIARSATISSLAQYSHKNNPTPSSSTVASSSMKSYFASSSIRRYESMVASHTSVAQSHTNSLPLTDSTPTTGTIISYFKNASVKSQTTFREVSSSSSSRASTVTSSTKKLTSLQRFMCSSSTKSASEHSTKVAEETATIDLSLDDDNDASEEPQIITLDIYDSSIITPEKSCPSITSSNPNINEHIHTTYTTSIINTSIEMDNFTPASVSNSSIQGSLSGDDTPSITFSAPSTDKTSTCHTQNVVKTTKGQRLSKFFKPPVASSKGKTDNIHTATQPSHGIASMSSSSSTNQDNFEIEQLADRLLANGDDSIHSPKSDNSSRTSTSPIGSRTDLFAMNTVDVYECTAIEDEEFIANTANNMTTTAEASEEFDEKSTPLKRPSFVAFSSKSSLERLQKQRVTSAHYKLSLLQSSSDSDLPTNITAKDDEGRASRMDITNVIETNSPEFSSIQHKTAISDGYEECVSLSPPLSVAKGLFAKFAFHGK